MSHVLVVDDEGDSLEFVARFLGRSGHRVTSAQDGRDALGKLLATTPDAVVLDLRMPAMDGMGLLEVMRSYLRWHRTPVIILSAHVTPAEDRKVREMGVVHVFHKADFELSELGRAVDEVTKRDQGDTTH